MIYSAGDTVMRKAVLEVCLNVEECRWVQRELIVNSRLIRRNPAVN